MSHIYIRLLFVDINICRLLLFISSERTIMANKSFQVALEAATNENNTEENWDRILGNKNKPFVVLFSKLIFIYFRGL